MLEEMFAGYHITYNIAKCRMIRAPVYIDWDWSLYVWNFERGTVVVIDPVNMVAGREVLMEKHEPIVHKLHKAMQKCKEEYFNDPDVDMEGWTRDYISIQGANCGSTCSGLYTMFYARYFDGQMLTRIVTPESQNMHKFNILHQLLSLAQNNASLPPILKAALQMEVEE